jgi:SAM-dependent methyltransferase
LQITEKDMVFEEINCELCNSNKKKLVFQKQGLLCSHVFNIVKCLKCGLVYVSPRLTQRSAELLYSESYYGSNNKAGVSEYWDNEEIRVKKARYILAIINSVRHLSKEDRILDIGCGKGDLIRILSKDGYQAEGVELSLTAYNQLIDNELCVYHGDIAKGLLHGKKYDVIVSADVIEHVYSPKDFLKSVYELLDERGIFLCLTDMADYFLNIEKSSWVQLTPDVHIYYFDQNTFKKYFTECGFVEANQYNYFINGSRRINKLMKKIGVVVNDRPINTREKLWIKYLLKTMDKLLNTVSYKPMKLWNIPLMRKVDL